MVETSTSSPLLIGVKMTLSEKLNSPFPYYLNDDRKNTLLALSVALFVVFFLHVYQPQDGFDIILNSTQKFVIGGGVTFALMFINIVLLPKLLPRFLDAVHWTVKKYILHTLWICFTIAFVNVIIDKVFICPEKPLFDIIIHIIIQVGLTGIIPITIMALLFRNNLLRENLKSAINANQELEKIQTLKKEAPKTTSNRVTIYSDTSETLTFNLPELLFIEADDNYSTVFWKNGHGLEKKLLRVNLKSIENQLNNSFTIRCHRSYIVNVHAISAITGNTNGYKLQIRDSDFSIPVSRPKGKELIEKISQLKSMMELY